MMQRTTRKTSMWPGIAAAASLLAAAVAIAVAVAMAIPGGAYAATLAAADFAKDAKVVASYLKGDDGNKRAFRATSKVTGLASSKPKVVSARLAAGGYGFDVTIKKAGKAKLTYSLGGVRKSVAFKVVKYSNPVKTFKVGGKNYAGKFKVAKSYRLAKQQQDSGTVRVTAAKGWRLKKMYSGFSEKNSIAVRNGDALGSMLNVCAVFVHKTTGLVETIELRNGS